MKISKIIFALAIGTMITVTSCRDKKTESKDDHGHGHNADGSHMNDETIEQEEFQVGKDSTEIKTETHSHDNGSEHRDH
jgi:hypothetical protein